MYASSPRSIVASSSANRSAVQASVLTPSTSSRMTRSTPPVMRSGPRPYSPLVLRVWQPGRPRLWRLERGGHSARDPHAIRVGVAIAVPLPVAPAVPHRFRDERWPLTRVPILEHAQLEHAALLGVRVHQLVAVQADHHVSVMPPATRRANI